MPKSRGDGGCDFADRDRYDSPDRFKRQQRFSNVASAIQEESLQRHSESKKWFLRQQRRYSWKAIFLEALSDLQSPHLAAKITAVRAVID